VVYADGSDDYELNAKRQCFKLTNQINFSSGTTLSIERDEATNKFLCRCGEKYTSSQSIRAHGKRCRFVANPSTSMDIDIVESSDDRGNNNEVL
jgi:hypothetical protein